jgi:hypothetical protein
MGEADRSRRPAVPELAGAVRAQRRQQPPLRGDRAGEGGAAPADLDGRRDRHEAFNTEGESVAAIVDEAEAKILAVSEGGRARRRRLPADGQLRGPGAGPHPAILERPGGEADFIPTGIGAWDDLMDGGMRGGELHVVAARPRPRQERRAADGGHQRVALQRRGKRWATSGSSRWRCPACSGPTARSPRSAGCTCRRSSGPSACATTDWPGITEGVELLRQMGIHINDRPALTINNVRSAARKLSRRTKLALIGVDYLGLMRGMDPKMNRAYQIEEITQGLKNLAKELGVPVMLLVQLKRTVDERADHMPTLATCATAARSSRTPTRSRSCTGRSRHAGPERGVEALRARLRGQGARQRGRPVRHALRRPAAALHRLADRPRAANEKVVAAPAPAPAPTPAPTQSPAPAPAPARLRPPAPAPAPTPAPTPAPEPQAPARAALAAVEALIALEEEDGAEEPDAYVSCRTGEIVLVGLQPDEQGRITIPVDLVTLIKRQIVWSLAR